MLILAADLVDREMYDGAHVGMQLVGRRLEEERILVLVDYVGEAVAHSVVGRETGSMLWLLCRSCSLFYVIVTLALGNGLCILCCLTCVRCLLMHVC